MCAKFEFLSNAARGARAAELSCADGYRVFLEKAGSIEGRQMTCAEGLLSLVQIVLGVRARLHLTATLLKAVQLDLVVRGQQF